MTTGASTLPPEITAAAGRHWRLFPVEAKGKLPLVKEWPTIATSDQALLEAWSAQYSACNWGLATGKASGVFVIDVDGVEGRAALEELARQGLILPETLTVTTGRAGGGEHRYYRMPDGVDVRNDQSGRIAGHIDVRGTGGFVVVPPSVHATGKRYSFIDADAPIADAPVWVIERLRAKPAATKAHQAADGVIGPGSRTLQLVSLAGTMHRQGIPAALIEAALNGLNAAFVPPHPPEKIHKMVTDMTRRYEGGRMPEERRPDLLCLRDVAPREVDWLWKPYLPKGMLAMLSGDPAAGKTFISLALAAGFTTGCTPNGEPCQPINVLYLSNENAPAEVVRPRFDLLGGDASRFHILRGSVCTEEGEEKRGAVSLADTSLSWMPHSQTQRAGFVVVDPIQSYLTDVDLHRSNETRPVLDGLAKLAEKHQCTILLLRHQSKQIGGKAIYRGLGSIDLTGAVRSEMLAGSLPDDPEVRALVHTKSNVGVYGPALGYSIDGEGRFSWTGHSDVTADQMLAAPSNSQEWSAVSDAREWLKEFLAAGSQEQKECKKRAEEAGISFATLRRAKDALRVRSYRETMRGPWLWALPEGAQEDAHTKNLSTFVELSAFEDAQASSSNTKKLNVTPLFYEDAQKLSVSTSVSTFDASQPEVRL